MQHVVPVALQTLVVESNFSSRKELVSLLQATMFVGEIEQAPSVRDGITSLSAGRTDACLLGSSLSLQRATWFLETAKSLSLKKPCALIAVGKTEDDCTQLIASGADGALHLPLEPMSFTQLVQRAVEDSRARFSGTKSLAIQLEKTKFTSRVMNVQQYEHGALAEIIQDLAVQLEAAAAELTAGRLKLSAGGLPSLATQDALRIALESAFPTSANASVIGSEDHRFVTAVVNWFVERVHSGQKQASDNLRKRLIAAA